MAITRRSRHPSVSGRHAVGDKVGKEYKSDKKSGLCCSVKLVSLLLVSMGCFFVVALRYHENGKVQKDQKDAVKTSSPPRSRQTRPALRFWPSGHWVESSRIRGGSSKNTRVWISNTMKTEGLSLERDFLVAEPGDGLSRSHVSKEATPIPPSFRALSNYELTCWVGSRSARLIREAFLSLRPQLFQHQRKFKFHYYPVENLTNPMKDWREDDATRFRKCKILLVSLDEMEGPISTTKYASDMKTFLMHLVNAFPDETFPIWMLTINKPTGNNMSTQLCFDSDQSASIHPCNSQLLDMLDVMKPDRLFPTRVKLMDNTDLLSNANNVGTYSDVISMISLRIFALVGKQVEIWRSIGQEGRKDGLSRNGTLEPNFELIPYNFSGTVAL